MSDVSGTLAFVRVWHHRRVTIPPILEMFQSALRASWDDNVPRLGASLAYYTLFAIAPVLLVAIAIAGLAFGAEAVRGEIVGQIDQLVGREGAQAVQSLLEGASQRRAGHLATIVGSITLMLAATGAFLELQTALNTIWRVKPNPNAATFKTFVWDRVRSFGLVVAIGFLLLVSLAVSAALAALGTWLDRISPGMPIVWNAVNVIVSLAVITALFTLLYPFLPDVKLRWRDVVVGAFVTAVLFSIGKQLIGLYLGQVRPHPPTARPVPSLCCSSGCTTRLKWCCSAQNSRASTRIMKGGDRDRSRLRRRILPPQRRRRQGTQPEYLPRAASRCNRSIRQLAGDGAREDRR